MSTIDHESRAEPAAANADHGMLVREILMRASSVETELGWTVQEDDLVLAVRGDICTASMRPLEARLRDLVVQFPVRLVTLDLAGVSFADARAVTLLVELDRTCADAGSRLTVARPSSAVVRLLQLCGLRPDLVGVVNAADEMR
jgi:anti-sigma B factor antagonist